jgi:putative methyltransferase (TIGR04325 family)
VTLKTGSTIFSFIVSAIQFIIHRVKRKFSPPLLEYAAEGWETVLPVKSSEGWNTLSVVLAERVKWEPFLSAVKGTGPLGFNHEHSDMSLIEHLAFHNINITYGYVLALAAHLKTSLTVLDYGGGLGHYFQIGKALLPEVDFMYSCKEVAQMAEAGQQLNPEIQWYTDDSCFSTTFDLVIVGGSLQYIEKWQNFLQSLSTAVGGYLYLTGIPVTDNGDSFVAIQNSCGTRMLHWQFSKNELLKVINDFGLDLVREFVLEDCPFIKNAPSQCKMRGWLFRKK